MRHQRKYRFYEKPYSLGGRYAIAMAVSALVLLLAAIGNAYFGGPPAVSGAAALLGLLLSALGFVGGLLSFREKDVAPRLGVLGAIGSGIMFLNFLAIFLLGLRWLII